MYLSKYSVNIYWSVGDDCWIAEHPALPGCIADGKTSGQALKNLDWNRVLWLESRKEAGGLIPAPDLRD
jgi:predicted RNase H-like HicB family nuclease